MSLVGTRPPTVDEWEQYELHHRSRMSIKEVIVAVIGNVGRALYAVTSAVEDLVEKQQQDQAKAVFYRIRKIVEPFDGWLSRSRYLSRKEVVSDR